MLPREDGRRVVEPSPTGFAEWATGVERDVVEVIGQGNGFDRIMRTGADGSPS